MLNGVGSPWEHRLLGNTFQLHMVGVPSPIVFVVREQFTKRRLVSASNRLYEIG